MGRKKKKTKGQRAKPTQDLFNAAGQGNLEVVRALVTELGANVDQATQTGATPLGVAAQEGHLTVVCALVAELGANVDQAMQDGATPLYIAAQKGHFKVVRALVKELGANVDQAKSSGETPLYVAAQEGHDQIAKWLARHGADIPSEKLTDSNLARSDDLVQWLKKKSSCANPGCAKGGEKRCARCRKVRYCSRECQVAHHSTHKATCRPPTVDP